MPGDRTYPPSSTTADVDAATAAPDALCITAVAHAAPHDARPAVTIATAADLAYVDNLAKRHAAAVGFLPRVALEEYIRRGDVWLCTENADDAGYVLSPRRLRCAPYVRPIVQTAVAHDVQLHQHGRRLIEHLAATAAADGRSLLQCWCRANLPANHFWDALGFTAVGIRRPTTARGQPLILWRRPLNDDGRRRLLILPTAAGYRAMTSDPRRLLTAADRANLLTAAA